MSNVDTNSYSPLGYRGSKAGVSSRKQGFTFKQKIMNVGATVLAVALAATGGLVATSTAANASSSLGAGIMTEDYGFMGAIILTDTGLAGTKVYCIDPGTQWSGSAPTSNSGIVDNITPVDTTRAVSGDDMGRMNAALTQFGQTDDASQAAGVRAYMLNFTSASFYGNGSTYLQGDAGSIAAYNSIKAWVDANYVPGGAATSGSGSFTFTRNNTNNYDGTLAISTSPANAVGTVTLTNGVFTSTGTSSIANVGNGAVLQVTGVAPADADVNEYQMSASGSFTFAGGYANNVSLFEQSGFQRLVANGQQGGGSFNVGGVDPETRSTIFQPVLTTSVVSEYHVPGDSGSDRVQFALAADANGRVNQWRQYADDNTYAPITANGTQYFSETPFVEAATAPADAVVSAHATVTTDGTTTNPATPGVTYVATADTPFAKPGYYTWVWEIDAADQTASIARQLPAGYTWNDSFGQLIETHFAIGSITTKAQGAAPGATIHDDVIVGGPIPEGGYEVTVAGYQRPADATEAVCTPETLVFESTEPIAVTEVGTFPSEEFPVTEEHMPGIDFVETASIDGQVVHTGTCGAAEEFAPVEYPKVTTKAIATTNPGDMVTDVNVVTGPSEDFIVTPGGYIVTTWYLQKDGTTDATAVCDTSNIWFENSKTLVLVTGLGEFTATAQASPASGGTVYAIERYYAPGVDGGEPTLISEGACGNPDEKTVMTPAPPVPTVDAAEVSNTTLAKTGAYENNAGVFFGASGLVVLAGIAMIVVFRVRNRKVAAQD